MMAQVLKTRKAELIVYGYGRRIIYELKECDLEMAQRDWTERVKLPHVFTLNGIIGRIKLKKGRVR